LELHADNYSYTRVRLTLAFVAVSRKIGFELHQMIDELPQASNTLVNNPGLKTRLLKRLGFQNIVDQTSVPLGTTLTASVQDLPRAESASFLL